MFSKILAATVTKYSLVISQRKLYHQFLLRNAIKPRNLFINRIEVRFVQTKPVDAPKKKSLIVSYKLSTNLDTLNFTKYFEAFIVEIIFCSVHIRRRSLAHIS